MNTNKTMCSMCGEVCESEPWLTCGRSMGPGEDGDESGPPYCEGRTVPLQRAMPAEYYRLIQNVVEREHIALSDWYTASDRKGAPPVAIEVITNQLGSLADIAGRYEKLADIAERYGEKTLNRLLKESYQWA